MRMSKTFHNIIIALLVLFLAPASSFCCCLTGVVMDDTSACSVLLPSGSNKPEGGHCHSDESSNRPKCGCEHVATVVKNQLFDNFTCISPIFKKFQKASIGGDLVNDSHTFSLLLSAYQSPLASHQKTVPIYLQNSSFLF